MCVAIPGRIVAVGPAGAASIPGTVLIEGTERAADLIMVPEATIGDYVIVHSGYAIRTVPSARAAETLAMLDHETGRSHGITD